MLRRWLVCGAFVLLAALGATFVVRGPALAASPFFQAAGRIDVEYFPQPTAAEARILRALDERRDVGPNDPECRGTEKRQKRDRRRDPPSHKMPIGFGINGFGHGSGHSDPVNTFGAFCVQRSSSPPVRTATCGILQ